MDIPLVSVILPTYNRANLIKRALDSAVRETIPGDEIIVVDDGSTDDTAQVLEAYAGKIRYFEIPNSGAGAARNFGIRNSRNPLVAFLDSDDEWMPGKLGLQRALMGARPDILFCFSDFAVTFENGGESRKFLANWHKDPRPWDEILGPGRLYSSVCTLPPGIDDFKFHVGDLYPTLMKNAYVNTDTVIVRRMEAAEALKFPEDLPWGEDWTCYSHLARKGSAAYLDCETAWQHGHDGERLSDASILDGITTHIAIMERVWGADVEFQKTSGRIYRKLLRDQRLFKVRELIALGRIAEARAELRTVASPPLGQRVLALLPASMVRAMLAIRRSLISGFRNL